MQAHISFDISKTTCYVTASVALKIELLIQIINSNEMFVKPTGYFASPVGPGTVLAQEKNSEGKAVC